MARARTTRIDQIRADLKWDDRERRWVATATASTASGNKRLQAPGVSTTKALHRLNALFEEAHEGAFELEPKVHIPEARKSEHDVFVKRLTAFQAEKVWITDKRCELAIAFVKDYHMPTRLVAPLLGMSPQRLGRVLADFEMGKTYGPVGRPRKQRGEDDEDEED